MSRFTVSDYHYGAGPISEYSGMTHLPEMIAHLDVNIPDAKHRCCTGLHKINRLAWMVLLSNSLASFTVGFTISGAMHYALAEGIGITIAFLIQEIIHRIGDYTLLMKNRMNPLQVNNGTETELIVV